MHSYVLKLKLVKNYAEKIMLKPLLLMSDCYLSGLFFQSYASLDWICKIQTFEIILKQFFVARCCSCCLAAASKNTKGKEYADNCI